PAGLHRPETGLVPAAADRPGVGPAAGPDRQARVRPLALGRLLVPAGARGGLQARRLYQRPAPPGAGGAAAGRGAGGAAARAGGAWPWLEPSAAAHATGPGAGARRWRRSPVIELTIILIRS